MADAETKAPARPQTPVDDTEPSPRSARRGSATAQPGPPSSAAANAALPRGAAVELLRSQNQGLRGVITKVERKHEKLKRDYRNCQRELRVLRGRLRSSLLTRLPTLADDGTLERMEHKTLRSLTSEARSRSVSCVPWLQTDSGALHGYTLDTSDTVIAKVLR